MQIHEDLKQSELLPSDHWLDAGSVTGKNLVNSAQDFGVQIIGPTRATHKCQASLSPGSDVNQFVIAWQAKQATCPEGHTSHSWTPAIDGGHNEVIKIKFSPKDCRACPSRAQCTRSDPPHPTLTIRPQEHYLALQQAREQLASKPSTPGSSYSLRQGVEGTVSESACGPLGCDAHAMSVLAKRTCSTSLLPRLSISFVLSLGSGASGPKGLALLL